LRAQNRREAAIDAYDRAILLEPDLASAYNNRGVALAELGNQRNQPDLIAEAIASYQQAIKIAPTAIQYLNLARLYARQTDFQSNTNTSNFPNLADEAYGQARRLIEEELARIEDPRARIENQDLLTSSLSGSKLDEFYRNQATFFSENQAYYTLYIELLMELHQQYPSSGLDKLALELSERARARSFLEILNTVNPYSFQGIDHQELDPHLFRQERELRQELETAERNINHFRNQFNTLTIQERRDPQRRQNLQEQVETAVQNFEKVQQQHRSVLDQIREFNPSYSRLLRAETLTVEGMQHLLPNDNTLLLQYWLGNERSYLWVISKNNVESYELPDRRTIETAAYDFHRSLSTRSGSEQITTTRVSIALSKMLLDPIKDQLHNQRLLIAADGALHNIPFSALPTPKDLPIPVIERSQQDQLIPLAVDHEIINLPSISALFLIR
jgi:hypothetical protein